MNVRKYVHVEPGKAKLEMIDGYPQELLAIDRNHTVESLSKISPINIGTLFMIPSYLQNKWFHMMCSY